MHQCTVCLVHHKSIYIFLKNFTQQKSQERPRTQPTENTRPRTQGASKKKQTWADKTDLVRKYSQRDIGADTDSEAKKGRPLTTATGREDEHAQKTKEKPRPRTTPGNGVYKKRGGFYVW